MVFCGVFCGSCFIDLPFFGLVIALSVLRFTRLLVTPLVSSINEASVYPFGIFDLRGFWLPLWYIRFTRLLVTPLVS